MHIYIYTHISISILGLTQSGSYLGGVKPPKMRQLQVGFRCIIR